jgi:hypothetical protein
MARESERLCFWRANAAVQSKIVAPNDGVAMLGFLRQPNLRD